MNPVRLSVVILTSFFAFIAANAAQCGSETQVTVEGTFRVEKTSRPGGSVTRTKKASSTEKVSNATVPRLHTTGGETQAYELALNTAEGPVVYTRESGDVWTVVTPEETDGEDSAE